MCNRCSSCTSDTLVLVGLYHRCGSALSCILNKLKEELSMSNNECIACQIICEKCASCASQDYCADMQIPAFMNKTGCDQYIPKLDEVGEEDD